MKRAHGGFKWIGLGLVHEEKEDLNKIFFNFVTALQILQDRVSKCMPVLVEVACGRREWPSGYHDEPIELRT
jgi:hypothetical protein